MGNNELCSTLSELASYQDTINTIAARDMAIKKACKIAVNSIQAWGIVMNELNDVITTLDSENSSEDRAYRAGFGKALEIIMRANKYRREQNYK